MTIPTFQPERELFDKFWKDEFEVDQRQFDWTQNKIAEDFLAFVRFAKKIRNEEPDFNNFVRRIKTEPWQPLKVEEELSPFEEQRKRISEMGERGMMDPSPGVSLIDMGLGGAAAKAGQAAFGGTDYGRHIEQKAINTMLRSFSHSASMAPLLKSVTEKLPPWMTDKGPGKWMKAGAAGLYDMTKPPEPRDAAESLVQGVAGFGGFIAGLPAALGGAVAGAVAPTTITPWALMAARVLTKQPGAQHVLSRVFGGAMEHSLSLGTAMAANSEEATVKALGKNFWDGAKMGAMFFGASFIGPGGKAISTASKQGRGLAHAVFKKSAPFLSQIARQTFTRAVGSQIGVYDPGLLEKIKAGKWDEIDGQEIFDETLFFWFSRKPINKHRFFFDVNRINVEIQELRDRGLKLKAWNPYYESPEMQERVGGQATFEGRVRGAPEYARKQITTGPMAEGKPTGEWKVDPRIDRNVGLFDYRGRHIMIIETSTEGKNLWYAISDPRSREPKIGELTDFTVETKDRLLRRLVAEIDAQQGPAEGAVTEYPLMGPDPRYNEMFYEIPGQVRLEPQRGVTGIPTRVAGGVVPDFFVDGKGRVFPVALFEQAHSPAELADLVRRAQELREPTTDPRRMLPGSEITIVAPERMGETIEFMPHAGEAVSAEALSRQKSIRFFAYDTAAKKIRPMIGVDAIDAPIKPTEIRLQQNLGTGKVEMLDRGDKASGQDLDFILKRPDVRKAVEIDQAVDLADTRRVFDADITEGRIPDIAQPGMREVATFLGATAPAPVPPSTPGERRSRPRGAEYAPTEVDLKGLASGQLYKMKAALEKRAMGFAGQSEIARQAGRELSPGEQRAFTAMANDLIDVNAELRSRGLGLPEKAPTVTLEGLRREKQRLIKELESPDVDRKMVQERIRGIEKQITEMEGEPTEARLIEKEAETRAKAEAKKVTQENLDYYNSGLNLRKALEGWAEYTYSKYGDPSKAPPELRAELKANKAMAGMAADTVRDERRFKIGRRVLTNLYAMGKGGEKIGDASLKFIKNRSQTEQYDLYRFMTAFDTLSKEIPTAKKIARPFKIADKVADKMFDLMEGKLKPKTPGEKYAYEVIDTIRKEIGQRSQELGLKVGTITGKAKDWAPMEDYAPVEYTNIRRFLESKSFKHLRDMYIEEIAKKLDPALYKADKAKAILIAENNFRELKSEMKSRKFGHLEYERVLDEAILEKLRTKWARLYPKEKFPLERKRTLDVWVRYFTGARERLAWIESFGKDIYVKGVGYVPSKLRNMRMELSDANYGYVETIFSRYLKQGAPLDTRLVRMLRGIRTYQLTKLAFAFIPNSLQWFTNTIPQIDLKSAAETLIDVAKYHGVAGKEIKRRQRLWFSKTGAQTYKHAFSMTMLDNPEKLSKFADIMLRVHGFSGTESFNAVFAAHAGARHAIRISEKLYDASKKQSGLKWYRRKFYVEELKRYGLKPEDIAAIAKDGPLTFEKNAQNLFDAGFHMRRTTQFLADMFHLPASWSTPFGRLLTQFKNFSYNQTALVYEAAKDMGKFAKTKGAQGNPMTLMKMLPALTLAGALIHYFKKKAYPALGMHFYEELTAGKSWPYMVGMYLANSGGLGLLIDISNAAAFGGSSMIDMIGGPTTSDLRGFFQASADTIQELQVAFEYQYPGWVVKRRHRLASTWLRVIERMSPDMRMFVQAWFADYRKTKEFANWSGVVRDAYDRYRLLYKTKSPREADAFWDVFMQTQGAEYEKIVGKKPRKPSEKEVERWWVDRDKAPLDAMSMPGITPKKGKTVGDYEFWH